MQIGTPFNLPNGWVLEFTDQEIGIATKAQIRDYKSWRNLPDQQVSFATNGSRAMAFVTVHESTRWAECKDDPDELLRSSRLLWRDALTPFPSPAERDYAQNYAGIGPALPDRPQTNVLFHGEYHNQRRLGWADEKKTVP